MLMPMREKIRELAYLVVLLMLVVGLPLAILAYDRQLKPSEQSAGTKEFILTGNTDQGWVVGEVPAYGVISLWQKKGRPQKPVIEVNQGDRVVIKLRSSDVTHGFALKDYGIYIPEGIEPGNTAYVSFKADRAGSFRFWCTAFCGDIHPHMQGSLVVHPNPVN